MKKDDIVYLRHILDAISRIEEYIKGLNYKKVSSQVNDNRKR
jgi:uncharacterized protein with HEPN domain